MVWNAAQGLLLIPDKQAVVRNISGPIYHRTVTRARGEWHQGTEGPGEPITKWVLRFLRQLQIHLKAGQRAASWAACVLGQLWCPDPARMGGSRGFHNKWLFWSAPAMAFRTAYLGFRPLQSRVSHFPHVEGEENPQTPWGSKDEPWRGPGPYWRLQSL